MLRIPHCLGSWLTDGGKVVSPTHLLLPTPQKHLFLCFWYSCLLEPEWKNSPHQVPNPRSSGLYHSALTSVLPRHWFFFNSYNPSSHTIAMMFAQPLAEIYTRIFLGSETWLVLRADNLTAICEPIIKKMWLPQRLTTLCASTACYRDGFTFMISSRFHSSGVQVLISVCC
jgi:hypothetical protein